ncbi:DUF1289 domain-containing protein [Sedimenticola selenatireducens]|jgi:hypothetical protein|uniref:DUF1289 domain-containing protein n=1 Tax=Sedimenticola selenatireducens TaxID=191960 RepID=A0A558DXR4_9GAMM|nr:DUF1289 domain-containing protein [Sedimenticola selenatireducens]TVO70934.1 DUF1289 domain-containing protein [Sedimenticola selenatireducens]TVT65800.1 MAG: DUF1289 domain-containing protein [Sedimenticola selenatireducens]
MQFSPCKGGDFCSQEGTHCSGCGRSHEEIGKTRDLVFAVTQFAMQMGYENVEEFTKFVGEKAAKNVRKQQQMSQMGGIGIPIGK